MKQIQIVIFLLFISLFSLSGQQRELQLLHYNLFHDNELNNQTYYQKKEHTLKRILQEKDIDIFSFLEDGCDIVSGQVTMALSAYGLKEIKTLPIKHSICYNKDKVTILQSQSYSSPKSMFFYHQLQLKGVVAPIHLIVYKQPITEHPYFQHQEILNFVNERGIKGQLLLLGGSSFPLSMIKGYIIENKGELDFVNPLSFVNLYDSENHFIWHEDIDFLYVTEDIWLKNEGLISYKRSKNYFATDVISKGKTKKNETHMPFKFSLQINKLNQPDYGTPEVRVLNQDRETISFSILWDKDDTLRVEIISIIGNVFLDKRIAYEGEKKTILEDILSYPTGIYILKLSDSTGKIVFKKFMKY